MEIDPRNLGKPLYDEDQVITENDLQAFINELDFLFETIRLTEDEIIVYDAVLETLCELQKWIKYKKQAKIQWNENFWGEI